MTHDLLVARAQGRFLATRMLASVGTALAISLAMGAVANASSGLVGRLAQVPAAAPLALAFNGSSAALGQAFGGALGGLLITQAGAPSVTFASAVIAVSAAGFWWLTNGRAQPSPAKLAAS